MELKEKFLSWLFNESKEEKRIIQGIRERRVIEIDVDSFDKWSTSLDVSVWNEIKEDPEGFIEVVTEAFFENDTLNLALETYFFSPEEWEKLDIEKKKIEIKKAIRLVNFPENIKVNIEDCNRPMYDGKLVEVEGIIQYVSPITPFPHKAVLLCRDCGDKVVIDLDLDKSIPKSIYCPECGRVTQHEVDKIEYKPIQIMKVSEPIQAFVLPTALTVMLEGSFLDSTDPLKKKYVIGRNVRIVGIVRHYGKRKVKVYLSPISIEVLGEINIEITDDDLKKIKKLGNPDPIPKLVSSIAPGIIGMNIEKEALLLSLVGGNEYLKKGEVYRRGAIHILFVGEPSTGKSSIMEYIARTFPRAVFVTSGSLSQVGFGLALDRDPEFQTWLIRGGAAVQANQGILMIDEFQALPKAIIEEMKTAMSQQILTLAKAGINMRVKINTPIVGIMNPKGGTFDSYVSYIDQIDLPKDDKIALLQRFDLKFAIKDVIDEERDSSVAEVVTGMRKISPPVDPDLLVKYILYARNMRPVMRKEVAEEIKRYYVTLRKKSVEGEKKISPRILETLRRLSEAVAKLRLHNEVTMEDFEEAKKLLVVSLKQFGYVSETGEISVDKAEGRMSKTEKSKLNKVLDVLDELSKVFGGKIPEEDFLARVEEVLGCGKLRAFEWLRKLKEEGYVMSPAPKLISRVV